MVGLAIAFFFRLAPPRHTGGTRQVLTDGLPSYSVSVSFNYLLHVFPGFIARPFRGVGVGFEEPHLPFMVLLGELTFPRISHISAYAAHQGGLVLWYGLGRPVITSEIGNWSVFVLLGWRFVFGIIIKRDGREPHRQMPSRLWE